MLKIPPPCQEQMAMNVAPSPVFPRFLRLTLVLATLLGTAAQAASCPTALRVGISELGYSGFLEAGEVRGAAADVVREAARRMGCPVRVTLYPRARLFVEFSGGMLDVAASAAQNDERDRSGEFISYASTRFHLVLASEHAKRYLPASLDAFASHGSGKINVVRGAYSAPKTQHQLQRLQKAGRLEEVADFDVAFRKISAGRAGATLAPDMVTARLRKVYQLEQRTVVLPIPESPPLAVGAYLSHRMPQQQRAALAQAIRAMTSDGTVLAIYRRYVDEDTARAIAGKH
jgi:polar amino acid transport system substrate-binding protein